MGNLRFAIVSLQNRLNLNCLKGARIWYFSYSFLTKSAKLKLLWKSNQELSGYSFLTKSAKLKRSAD